MLSALLLLVICGCPSSGTTVCVPGGSTDGCQGTEWHDAAIYENLPDEDGGCPEGVYVFCPNNCPAGSTSREVMVEACQHASDHNWSACQVRYLCGPYEGVN